MRQRNWRATSRRQQYGVSWHSNARADSYWALALKHAATLQGCSDTEQGVHGSRRSTSCLMLFYGQHVIGSSSTTQDVVALTPGESEYYRIVTACSRLLGPKDLARDFGSYTRCAGVSGQHCVERISQRGLGNQPLTRASVLGSICCVRKSNHDTQSSSY